MAESLRKSTLKVILILAVAKLFGFLRQSALSYFYGAGFLSDIFITTSNIPDQLINLVTGALTFVFIPQYTKIRNNKDLESADRFTSQVLRLVAIISLIIIVVIQLFPGLIIRIFAAGFSDEQLAVSVSFLRVMSISTLAMTVATLFNGYLQAHRQFLPGSAITIVSNIIIIAALFLGFKTGRPEWILPFGYLIAKFAELVYIYFHSKKIGFRLLPGTSLRDDPELRRVLLLMVPVFIGSSTQQLNLLVNRSIASTFREGSVTLITNAALIKNLFEGIIVIAIANVTFPEFSQRSHDHDLKGLRRGMAQALSMINISMIPVSVGLMLFAEPVVKLVFERGEFTAADSRATALVLIGYAFGLAAFGMQNVYSRVFYSFHDTKTPMYVALLGVGINIALNFILSGFWGLKGLAWATSFSGIVGMILFFFALRRKIGGCFDRTTIIEMIKIVIVSVIGAGAARLFFDYSGQTFALFPGLMISFIIAAVIFTACAYLLKIDSLTSLIHEARAKR